MKFLLMDAGLAKIAKFVFIAFIEGCAGGCIYEVIEKVELLRWKVTLSDYLGANDISAKNIVINFRQSLFRSYYSFFWQNLTGDRFKWNYFKGNYVVVIIAFWIFLLFLPAIKNLFVNKKFTNIIMLSVISCLIPMGANICVILAPEGSFWEQQTAPIAMILPCMLWLAVSCAADKSHLSGIVRYYMVVILSMMLIWGSVYQVVIDQESMREGINNATSIGSAALERLFSSEEYDESLPIAVVGAPYNNALYYDTGISRKANIYTRIGGLTWWGNAFDLGAWEGIIKNRIGYRLRYCDNQFYNALCMDERLLEMPSYPEKGCCAQIDGVNVIKISNPQK